MTDSQNKSAWNDWANYLLHIVKKHDGDLEAIKIELKSIGLQDEKITSIILLIAEHKEDLGKLSKEIINLGLEIQQLKLTKLNESRFDTFYAEDYKVFKTELLTKAKLRGVWWGAISGGIISIIGMLLRIILKA